jgi:hypothetical protein
VYIAHRPIQHISQLVSPINAKTSRSACRVAAQICIAISSCGRDLSEVAERPTIPSVHRPNRTADSGKTLWRLLARWVLLLTNGHICNTYVVDPCSMILLYEIWSYYICEMYW